VASSGPRPPAIEHGRRCCRANRGGRRPLATLVNEANERERGKAGPGVSGRLWESEGDRGRAVAGH
jgi:hypothetical protein